MKSFFKKFIVLLLILTSCYKDDLKEFEKAKFQINSSIAAPLFYEDLTIKDTINFIPNFSINDTIYITNNNIHKIDGYDFSFNGYQIDSAQFKLHIENSFPVKAYVQIYFIKNNIVYDSLFTINKQHVGNSTISDVFIDVSVERYQHLVNCDKIEIICGLEKYQNFSPNQKISIGCGVIVNITKKL